MAYVNGSRGKFRNWRDLNKICSANGREFELDLVVEPIRPPHSIAASAALLKTSLNTNTGGIRNARAA